LIYTRLEREFAKSYFELTGEIYTDGDLD
jgi:hypothetical protein